MDAHSKNLKEFSTEETEIAIKKRLVLKWKSFKKKSKL